MNKFSKIALLAGLFVGNTAHAGGFMPGNFLYSYAWISDALLLVGIFGAILLFFAAVIGKITGKFIVRLYVPFIFLLIAIFSIIIDFYFG